MKYLLTLMLLVVISCLCGCDATQKSLDAFLDRNEDKTALGVDEDLRNQLVGMRGKIAPNQIGKYGQLQEWLEDVDDPENVRRALTPTT